MQVYSPFSFIVKSIIVVITLAASSALQCFLDSKNPTKVAYTITISKSGDGNFTRVQDAVDSITSGNNKWIKIHVNLGTYVEQVLIPRDKECIFLEGEGISGTIISFNAHEATDTSAAFTSFSDNFVAKDISLKNSYNHEVEGSKSGVSPALAVRVYGDKSAFYRCGFIGYQDTLWDVRGRHYFKSCFIAGAIDFIWGSGQSIYEDTKISILSNGFITAQGRNSTKDSSGFVFIRGSIGRINAQTYLGRAYGLYLRVIFYGTKFDDVISPQRWNAWHLQGHKGNFTYAEVSCSGPGADISKRVPWIKKFSSAEILQYSVATFIDIDGWIALQS